MKLYLKNIKSLNAALVVFKDIDMITIDSNIPPKDSIEKSEIYVNIHSKCGVKHIDIFNSDNLKRLNYEILHPLLGSDLIKCDAEDIAFYLLEHELTRSMNISNEYIVLDIGKLSFKLEEHLSDALRKLYLSTTRD